MVSTNFHISPKVKVDFARSPYCFQSKKKPRQIELITFETSTERQTFRILYSGNKYHHTSYYRTQSTYVLLTSQTWGGGGG